MKKEVNPKETSRAQAYELWMKAPNPMVTFFKTIDVTRIVKVSKKRELKFNMLLDWCIGRAASTIKEFYLLPVGNSLMQYDALAVNTIVKNKGRSQFLRHPFYRGLGGVQSRVSGAHCSSNGKVSGSGFVR